MERLMVVVGISMIREKVNVTKVIVDGIAFSQVYRGESKEICRIEDSLVCSLQEVRWFCIPNSAKSIMPGYASRE
jgi:hypothetical protein